MNARSFDRVTQQAAHGVSRRASLLALGAAGLSGVGAGVGTAQAKGGANPCKKQIKQCIKGLTPVCAGDATCLAKLQTCCPIIGRCDFNGFIQCTNA